MAGGLFGGLAQGIGAGANIAFQKKYLDMQKDYQDAQKAGDQRDAEVHAAKMDELNYQKAQRDKVDNAMTEVASYLNPQPQQVPEPVQAAPGLGGNAAVPVSDPRAPGLASTQAPLQPQQPQMPPNVAIQKAALTSDFLSNPDKLNGVASIFAKHGLTKEMMPWLNQAYQAKKSGIVDAMGQAIAGNGAGAAAALRQGGIPVEGDLQPANKDGSVWTGMVGGKQQTFDVRKLGAMADPVNYLNSLDAKPEQEAKLRKLNADADSATANAQESRAKAKVYASGGMGGGRGGGSGSGPKVQKTVETNQGIVAVMSDGSQKLLKGEDGKPMFGTSNLKIAAGLIGKTLDPLGDNKDIADRVTNVAGQLGGGNTAAPANASSNPVRKFNPATGKFE